MRKSYSITLTLFIMSFLTQSALAQYTDMSSDYSWERKWIGGGGFFMGMAFSPVESGLMYVRSDVCGPHRRDIDETDVWTYLGDSYPVTADIGGSAGITAHPTDPNTVFMLSGSYNDVSNGGVYRSTNKGVTWDLVLNKRVHGNDQNSKKLGEPIAVDAKNINVIYAGTQYDGLFRSASAGDLSTWSLITSVPQKNTGVRCVAIDTFETTGSPARSRYVYAGVHNDSIYQSEDGGLTFTLMSSGPSNPLQMIMSSNRELIVGTDSGIWKYNLNNGWENISPVGEETSSFLCVDVNPNNAQELIAAVNKKVFRSNDGGATWTSVSLLDGEIIDATPGFNFIRDPISSPAAIHFDPFSSDVYVNDAYGVWKTSDVWASITQWEIQYKNINNTITIDMTSPPKGTSNGVLYSASPDVEGFRFNDGQKDFYSKYSRLGPNTTSVDFCEEFPDVIYFTKSKKWSPTYQAWVFRADNGILNNTSNTFAPDDNYYKSYPFNTEFNSEFYNPPTDGSVPAYNAGGAKIAVSATDPAVAIYFSGGSSGSTFYTKDGGDTWNSTVGLPYSDFLRRVCGGGSCSEYDFNMPIGADLVAGNIFYAYYDLTGEFFVSEDGGKTWSERTNAGLPSFNGVTQSNPLRLETAPYVAGDVWIALDDNGLYHSTDTAQTFSPINFFNRATQVVLGKNKSGQSNPTVFVFGQAATDSQWGVFRSNDMGSTWELITKPSEPGAPYPRSMTADRQVYGRVYLAHGTTGIRVGEMTTQPSPDSAPVASTDITGVSTFSDRVSINWMDNADNETKFRIYRKSGSGDFERVGMVGFNTTTFIDIGLTPSTTYEYYVLAYNEDAESPSATVSVTTTSDANNPTVNIRKLDDTASEVNLDSATFEVYSSNPVSVDLNIQLAYEGLAVNIDDYVALDVSVVLPAGDTSVVFTLTPKADNNPAEGTESVVIRITEGNGYFAGAFYVDTLNIIDDSGAGVPANVVVQGQSPTWVQVTWDDNTSGEEGFEILRSTTSGGQYDTVGTVDADFEEFDDTNVQPSTTYYYVVRAYTSNGVSDNSPEGFGNTAAATIYPKNFKWNRLNDWDGNITTAGDTDSLSNLTWSYLVNPVDTDEGKNVSDPWWEQPLKKLDKWDGTQWYDGNQTPKISALQLDERRDVVSSSTYEGIPVVRWTNPANKTIWVKIAGRLTTEFTGNNNASFDRTADVVIVLKDSSGNYNKIFENQHFGFYGDDFTDAINIERKVKSGEQIFVSIHQPNNKKYNYRVELEDSISIQYVADDGEVLTQPGQTGSLTATTGDFETIELVWTDVSDELGYRIERKFNGGSYEEVTTVNADVTSFTDTELVPSTTYTYRVVPYTIGTEALPSPEASTTTDTGIVMDNNDGSNNGVDIDGSWSYSSFDGNGEFYGENFLNDDNDNKGSDYVRFTPDIPVTGSYIVSARWVAASYYDDSVSLEIHHPAGVDTFLVNQKSNAGKWMVLDTLSFNAGTDQYLDWETYGTTQSVVVDAVRFILSGEAAMAQYDTTYMNNKFDDAGENDSGVIYDISSSGITLRSGRAWQAEKAMFIFRDVDIPQGASLNSAKIQFESRSGNTGSNFLTTYVLVENNLSPVDLTGSNISSRPLLNDSVQWDIPLWTDNTKGPDQLTPDISGLVQSLVNNSNWTSGSSDIAVIIQGHNNNSENWREIETYNGGAPAELIIEYNDSNNTAQKLTEETEFRSKAHFKDNLVIYPNPAKDQLFINGIDLYNVTVLNSLGAVVLQGKIGVNNPLSIRKLKSGIYFLKVTAKSSSSIQRIIIEK